MKTIIVLIALLALGVAGVYFFGGYRTLDPDQQGNTAKAAITPGMTWQQVLSVAGESPRFQPIVMIKEKGGLQIPRPGPEVDFNRDKLADRLQKNHLPDGFRFVYRFSERVAFAVQFDGSGKVESVEDVMTMADLLHTR